MSLVAQSSTPNQQSTNAIVQAMATKSASPNTNSISKIKIDPPKQPGVAQKPTAKKVTFV